MKKRTVINFYSVMLALFMVASVKNTMYSQNLPAGAEDQKRVSSQMWSTLSKVSFKMQESVYGEMSLPVFSNEIKALDGKEITLPGYLVPADGLKGVFRSNHFILSSLPLAACFFCGVGGPESVVEVYMDKPLKYTTDAISIKGTLNLNSMDSYQMIYILEDAEFLGVSE